MNVDRLCRCKTFDQVVTFQKGTPQFNRLMGSPNLSSKFFAFTNHHNAIGNKLPIKIVLMPKQVPVQDAPEIPGKARPIIGEFWAALICA